MSDKGDAEMSAAQNLLSSYVFIKHIFCDLSDDIICIACF